MTKKIIIASDSYKGSATSKEIGTYISEGIHSLYPDYKTVVYAIADGGEGTVEALMDTYKGEFVSLWVNDPLGNEILASYGLIEKGKTAIIEMAKASGLTLIEKNKLDILQASTYGTGQMILDAVKRGVNKIYIGIGGSATNDGGMGMAEALGVSFLNKNGNTLKGNGENLQHIDTIDLTNIKMYNGYVYHNYEELEEAIHSYIRYYNEDRIKEKLGWMSPLEYKEHQHSLSA